MYRSSLPTMFCKIVLHDLLDVIKAYILFLICIMHVGKPRDTKHVTSTTIPRLTAKKSKNIIVGYTKLPQLFRPIYCHHSLHVYKLVQNDLNKVIFTDSVHITNVLLKGHYIEFTRL